MCGVRGREVVSDQDWPYRADEIAEPIYRFRYAGDGRLRRNIKGPSVVRIKMENKINECKRTLIKGRPNANVDAEESKAKAHPSVRSLEWGAGYLTSGKKENVERKECMRPS